MTKKKKKDHFILGVVLKGDDDVRITKSERYHVQGGTKETHEQAADFVHEVDKEMVKDPPQTEGEVRMILRDAAKKAGLPRPTKKPQ